MTDATISFDLADALGVDYNYSRTKLWVEFNTENKRVTDADGQVRLGAGVVVPDPDGTGSIEGIPIASGSTNPTSFQVKIHYDAPPKVPGVSERIRGDFGWMTITGDADLADLEEEQYAPPSYQGAFAAELEGIRDEAEGFADSASTAADRAEAAADLATDISGIDTPDALIAALGANPASATRGVLAPKGSPMFTGGLGLNAVALNPRLPVSINSSVDSDDAMEGTDNLVAVFLGTNAEGDFTGAEGVDAGYFFGLNSFCRINAAGLNFALANVLEAAITAPTGASIPYVIGLQAGANFFGEDADADVGTIISLHAGEPHRALGAVGGTVDTAISLRVGAPTIGSNNLAIAVDTGGISRFGGKVELQDALVNQGSGALVIAGGSAASQGAAIELAKNTDGGSAGILLSQSGSQFLVYDSGANAIRFSVTKAGVVGVGGSVVNSTNTLSISGGSTTSDGAVLELSKNSNSGNAAMVLSQSGSSFLVYTGAIPFQVYKDNRVQIGDGGTVGFFGATPTARPTGVAVTAAGIHAALVTLGLIAA